MTKTVLAAVRDGVATGINPEPGFGQPDAEPNRGADLDAIHAPRSPRAGL